MQSNWMVFNKKRTKNRYITLIFMLFILFFSCKSNVENNHVNSIWPEVNNQMKPWTRWWWMGNAVNSKDLANLIEVYAKKGIGGLEITPIYGVKGFEDESVDFLSDKWMDLLHFSIQEAKIHGMQVDLNLGTGWPYGGPHIRLEQAAKRLVLRNYHIRGDETFTEKITSEYFGSQVIAPPHKLVAVFAYQDDLKIDLMDKVDEEGTLHWIPDQGDWEIIAAFSQNTMMQVKRPAPGAEGLVVDHFSKDNIEAYLEPFESSFDVNPPALRSVFNDSYEAYGASFSSLLFEEFIKRRGYDVRNFLRELSSEKLDMVSLRVQADYRQTISDMLLENFIIPWDLWANNHNYQSRLQAHGSPGNLLDLYGAADIPETETFGSSDFEISGFKKYSHDQQDVPDHVMMKFSSSAANVLGKPLTSSETFTWLGEHFHIPLSLCKPELEKIFLSGVNHIFFHGTAYSPEDAEWPGWLFYAATHFSPNNSLWSHIDGLNEYITQSQSILQSGKADNEILIYWPIQDVWHRPGNLDMQLTVHNVDDWLKPSAFYKIADRLIKTGYSMDFISDRQIKKTIVEGQKFSTSLISNPYQALIVPKTNFMSLSTLQQILKLAKDGGTVIFEALPEDVPGFHEFEKSKRKLNEILSALSFTDAGNNIYECKIGNGRIVLSKDVRAGLEFVNIQREELVDLGLNFIRRVSVDDKYYYLVNHTSEPINQTIPINFKSKSVIILNPQDGSYGQAAVSQNKKGGTDVKIQLSSGEALFLKASMKQYNYIKDWNYYKPIGEPLDIEGPWELEFIEGGPTLPKTQFIERLNSWTTIPGLDYKSFSGTVIYSTQFELFEKNANEYLLDLGDVRESAKVWINDHETGLLWSNPYQVKVGKYLKKGINKIEIEVVNLMANRISYMDREGIPWKIFYNINMPSRLPQNRGENGLLDASEWEPLPSGLLGPVKIIPYKSAYNLDSKNN